MNKTAKTSNLLQAMGLKIKTAQDEKQVNAVLASVDMTLLGSGVYKEKLGVRTKSSYAQDPITGVFSGDLLHCYLWEVYDHIYDNLHEEIWKKYRTLSRDEFTDWLLSQHDSGEEFKNKSDRVVFSMNDGWEEGFVVGFSSKTSPVSDIPASKSSDISDSEILVYPEDLAAQGEEFAGWLPWGSSQ